MKAISREEIQTLFIGRKSFEQVELYMLSAKHKSAWLDFLTRIETFLWYD